MLPRDERELEWGQQRERREEGGGAAYQRRMKEWWDQRGGQASRGVMKFVWDTLEFYCYCAVPVFSLYSLAPAEKGNGEVRGDERGGRGVRRC